MSKAEERSGSIPKIIKILAVVTVVLLVSMMVMDNFIVVHPTPPESKCINNLRLIDGAKQMWAMENNKTNSDVPTWTDLQSFIARAGDALPYCPSGGKYTLGAMSNLPTCSIPGHALPPASN